MKFMCGEPAGQSDKAHLVAREKWLLSRGESGGGKGSKKKVGKKGKKGKKNRR